MHASPPNWSIAVPAAFGAGAWLVSFTAPEAYPDAAPLIWSGLFWLGVALMLLAASLGLFKFVIVYANKQKTGQAEQGHETAPPEQEKRIEPRIHEAPVLNLEHSTTGISMALLAAVMGSAWGKRQLERSKGTQSEKIIKAMNIALYKVRSAARNGELEIRGQIPGTTEYEVIPPDTWIHANFRIVGELHPKVEITGGIPINPKLEKPLEKVLSYEYIDVNSRQFEAVIDSLNPEEI